MPEDRESTLTIAGRNPVIELLKSEQPVDKILILRQEPSTGSGGLGKIIALSKQRGIPVKEVVAEKLNSICPGVNHQGVIAICAAWEYSSLEDIIQKAADLNEPLLVVITDGIEDPHNLGAIIRTACLAGAHGVIIPKRHGAGLTATVMKASAGAAQHIPIVRVPNLASTVDFLKKQNVWVYAAEINGEMWCETDYSGAAAIIIGSEGDGVSRLLREKSDRIVSLPMYGQINSLNASVAAGIILYEVARQRHSIKAV